MSPNACVFSHPKRRQDGGSSSLLSCQEKASDPEVANENFTSPLRPSGSVNQPLCNTRSERRTLRFCAECGRNRAGYATETRKQCRRRKNRNRTGEKAFLNSIEEKTNSNGYFEEKETCGEHAATTTQQPWKAAQNKEYRSNREVRKCVVSPEHGRRQSTLASVTVNRWLPTNLRS